MADDIIKLDREALKALITEAVTEALEVAEIVTTEDLREFAAELTEGGVFDQLDDDRDTPDPLPKRPILDIREPEPEPERPKLGERISSDRLLFGIDPNDQDTWGPRRTLPHQTVIACGVFNYNNGHNNPWVDAMADKGRQHNRARLSFNDGAYGPEVHSWEMEDGTTLRHGPVERDGRMWLRFASQFTGEGYHPDGKRERELRTGPGGSDPLYFDGSPRGQASFLAPEHAIRIGPGARPILIATEFKVEHWMMGPGHHAGPFEIHSPIGAPQSGVLTGSIHDGEVILWSKTTGRHSDQSPLAWPGRQPSGRDHITLAKVKLPPVGESITLIVEAVSDMSGEGQSYCDTHVVTSGGELQQVGGHDGPFGFFYADRDKSGACFWNTMQLYVPHRYWDPKHKRNQRAPWNWSNETPDGNVRRLDTAFVASAWLKDVSLADMTQHALSFR